MIVQLLLLPLLLKNVVLNHSRLSDVHSDVTLFDVAFPLPFHILQVPPIDVSSLIMFSRLLWATGLRGREGRSPHWGAEGLRGPASADRGESWVATWGVQWWPLWAGWLLKWKILRIWNKTADGFICLHGKEGSVVRRVVFRRNGGARLLGRQKKRSL